jgi:membrane protein YdbS with pleckstrin-like domain
MGYAEKQLVPGEQILYRAHYHWVFYRRAFVPFFLSVVVAVAAVVVARKPETARYATSLSYVSAGLFVLAALIFLALLVRARCDEFVITDRRVIHKMGVFAHETRQCPLAKVQDITVDQGILSRLLGYGDVGIETASEAGQMRFPSISDPEKLRTAIWTHVGPGGLAGSEPATVTGKTSSAERLARLEELKAKGLVTPEEFERKRRQIVEEL